MFAGTLGYVESALAICVVDYHAELQ